MKKAVLLSGAMLGSLFAQQAPTGSEWQEEQNLNLRKEQPRALFQSFPNAEAALKIDREKSPWFLSLDGKWKFSWVGNPDQRPKDFYKPEFSVSSWKDIKVPSSWQLEGYGTPIYSNQAYTFKRDWPRVMGEPPKDWPAYKDRNPVGSYRRTFTVPKDWKGKQIFVNFDGVDSFFYLWINGKYVGFSKDSRTNAAFNISPYLKSGENVIAAEVYRYSDGSYLECQDMWRLSGIFRSVYLYATPEVQIRDVFALPDLDEKYENATLKVNTWIRNLAADAKKVPSVQVQLLDAQGKVVAEQKQEGGADLASAQQSEQTLTLNVPNPAKWTAETPNLYTVVVSTPEESVSFRTGFRKVEIKNGRYMINGQKVKLRGVNRHEMEPDTGHHVTREAMMKDIIRLKEANVNHVRNSHYPNDPYWYELCDRYGIYVMDEANIESHGYYYGEASLSHPKEWEAAHVDRVRNMVQRTKNYPCVIFWSLGNEAGPGNNFAAANAAVKAIDTSRPTHYERNSSLVDVFSTMYPSVEWMQGQADNTSVQKPWYICEYAHTMNNALGNLADYWKAIESSDVIIGASIWEWNDQSIYAKYDEKGQPVVDLKRGKPEAGVKKFEAYGGDFNDKPNDGVFILKGVVFANRDPKPAFAEVKRVYQAIVTTPADLEKGEVEVFNKNYFIGLQDFPIHWELTGDGEVLQSGDLPAMNLAPREKAKLVIPFQKPASLAGGVDYRLRVSFHLGADTGWQKKGYEIAANQFALPFKPVAEPMIEKKGTLTASSTPARFTVKGEGFQAEIDRSSGDLISLNYGGKELLTAPSRFNAFRAYTDNDKWTSQSWFENGLHTLKDEATEVNLDATDPKLIRITALVKSRGTESTSIQDQNSGRNLLFPAKPLEDNALTFYNRYEWAFYPDGTIVFDVAGNSKGPKMVLPKWGNQFFFTPELRNFTWYGRGEDENYPDRKDGSDFGCFSRLVKNMFVPYPKPMEMANREDVQWCALRDDAGNGVVVQSRKNRMNVSALPYTPMELLVAPHPLELPESKQTVLSLDDQTLGLGGASCGPPPMQRDLIRSGTAYTYGFVIAPIAKKQNPVDVARRDVMLASPVEITRDARGHIELSCDTPGAKIQYRINGQAWQPYKLNFLYNEAGLIEAKASVENGYESMLSSRQFTFELPRANMKIVSASSFDPIEGNPANVIDGKANTYWHSKWRGGPAPYPHQLVIDLGQKVELAGIRVTPRQDQENGHISEYEVYVSEDGKNWGDKPADKGTLGGDFKTDVIRFEKPLPAKFVKFVALTETRGQPYAAIAELEPIATRSLAAPKPSDAWTVLKVSSEMPNEGEAVHVLDGNPKTYWHTQYGLFLAKYPHEIDFDLSEERSLTGMDLMPRIDSPNGRIKGYEIYVTNDLKNWSKTPVAKGEFKNEGALQKVAFQAKGRYVRFVATSAQDGGDYATAAEINFLLESAKK